MTTQHPIDQARRTPGRTRSVANGAIVARLVVVLLALTALLAAGSPAAVAGGPSVGDLGRALHVSAAATLSPQPSPTTAPPVSTTWTIGSSLQGRTIVLESFGSGSRRILVVGGVHGNEYGGPIAAQFAKYLRAHPSVLASGTQIDVVAYANPDGWALKRRTNARGVDVNRNFPSRNWRRGRRTGSSPVRRAGSEPETRALIALLAEQRYVRVVSLHSRIGVVDYDGKGGYTLARRIARASRYRVTRLSAHATYRGSMGSYVPERFHIPIVTWEFAKPAFTYRVLAGLLASVK